MQTFALESGCTALCHKLSTFIGGLVVLISALGNTSSDGHADYASYSLEISKGISLMREREALISEKQAASADLTLEWPSVNNPSAPESVEVNQSQLMENFKREYIDIIPPTWAAVSLSLSENKEELFLCRYEAGREPFTVRLPLTRHNSNEGEDEEEEEQEEVFEYSDIVKEFEDIMTCAHTNTHQAKDITQGNSTNAIEQWWVERRALDDRLAALLENVERFWLGGFKGLIQQNFIDREFLAMFQASFERILNKYLPSRRMKTAGRRGAAAKSSKRATIDPRIYELFIGLGDPTTEDLESSLLDLINFIIDILQFHGETNAYDEIEMDEVCPFFLDYLPASNMDRFSSRRPMHSAPTTSVSPTTAPTRNVRRLTPSSFSTRLSRCSHGNVSLVSRISQSLVSPRSHSSRPSSPTPRCAIPARRQASISTSRMDLTSSTPPSI